MKINYSINHTVKTIKIPNAFLFNRFLFGILKLFIFAKSFVFFKIKYKQIKPVLKMAKNYSDFEIVNVKSRQGYEIRILL